MSLDGLVELTDGMTGADIAAVVNAAAMAAIKEQISAGGKDKIRIIMVILKSTAKGQENEQRA